jgi:PleD family two-component response regulator
MLVLQIDDDRDDLELFGDSIKRFDSTIEYRGVETIEEAFKFLDSNIFVPDIMFLDINMPRYSGFDCYTIFQADSRCVNTRFIFLSTTIYRKDIPPGCDFMLKQYSEKNYVTVLNNLLKPH